MENPNSLFECEMFDILNPYDKYPLCMATGQECYNEFTEKYLDTMLSVNDKVLYKLNANIYPTPMEEHLCTLEFDLPGEIWKDIPGFEDRYQISNKRRVRTKTLTRFKKTIRVPSKYFNIFLYIKDKVHQINADKLARLLFDYVTPILETQDSDDVNAAIDRKIKQHEPITPMDIFSYTKLNNLPDEEWKPVLSTNGVYAVSNLGRAKRVQSHYANYTSHAERYSEKIMRLRFDKDGYVLCYMHFNGQTIYGKMHRLVLEQFKPQTADDIANNRTVAHHINNCRFDNNVKNLQWVTMKENSQRRINSRHKPKD